MRFFSEDIVFDLKGKRAISKWLRSVASENGYQIGEMNYIFCSDPYILDINQKFLGHDYYTDIITFDNSEDYLIEKGKRGVSADIYISIDTVRSNGQEYGEGFEKELHRVIVHGLLHLIGYDDVTPAKQKKMRAAENRALEMLCEK
ncbi:MAG: rRNA maturation RNase YbeY [Bacteroidales bacterium]|nr:rRNA maturation RNase YbeY [Candidatus Cacconaster equi]